MLVVWEKKFEDARENHMTLPYISTGEGKNIYLARHSVKNI